MDSEKLQQIKDNFPTTVGAQLVLVPWINNVLDMIDNSWHNDDAVERERKATEKKLLKRMIGDLKLKLNPDIPQQETGRSTGGAERRSEDSEPGAGV